MALILENVGKTFENTGQATLKNINLEIQPGEFLCVVGKSGCGKSTLLNLIAGLEAPTEGRVPLCSWEKRMRQKHAAESDCRPGKTDRRKNSFKWKRSESTWFGTDSDVSGTCSVSVAECYPKYKVWNENKWSSEGRTGNTGRKIFEDDAVRTI